MELTEAQFWGFRGLHITDETNILFSQPPRTTMNAGTFAIITFALANLSCPLDARGNQELSAPPLALRTTEYEGGGVSEDLDHQHRLVERQSCTPNSPEQNRLVAETLCDPYYVNNVTYSELFDCGVSFANHEVSRCGTDRGTLCATYNAISDGSMVDYAKVIQNYCFRVNLLSETLANCSSECRTAFEVFADNFGCCVHPETQITEDELAQTLTPLLSLAEPHPRARSARVWRHA